MNASVKDSWAIAGFAALVVFLAALVFGHCLTGCGAGAQTESTPDYGGYLQPRVTGHCELHAMAGGRLIGLPWSLGAAVEADAAVAPEVGVVGQARLVLSVAGYLLALSWDLSGPPSICVGTSGRAAVCWALPEMEPLMAPTQLERDNEQ